MHIKLRKHIIRRNILITKGATRFYILCLTKFSII